MRGLGTEEIMGDGSEKKRKRRGEEESRWEKSVGKGKENRMNIGEEGLWEGREEEKKRREEEKIDEDIGRE
jgi:hypothetical protein